MSADGSTGGERAEIETLLRGMLEPDGYQLVVHEWPRQAGERVRLEIVATEAACEDCLAPKEVLRLILADRLPAGTPPLSDADIVYPGDAISRSIGGGTA
jgi:hypothetical protein